MLGSVRKRKLTYNTEDGSTSVGYNFTGTGYMTTDTPSPTSNESYLKDMHFSRFGMAQLNGGGSATTYYADNFNFAGSFGTNAVIIKGSPDSSKGENAVGPFGVNMAQVATTTGWWITAALSAKPPTPSQS